MHEAPPPPSETAAVPFRHLGPGLTGKDASRRVRPEASSDLSRHRAQRQGASRGPLGALPRETKEAPPTASGEQRPGLHICPPWSSRQGRRRMPRGIARPLPCWRACVQGQGGRLLCSVDAGPAGEGSCAGGCVSLASLALCLGPGVSKQSQAVSRLALPCPAPRRGPCFPQDGSGCWEGGSQAFPSLPGGSPPLS